MPPGKGELMFIYALRATTLKLFGIMLLAAVLLVSLAVMIPAYGSETPVSADTQEQTVTYGKLKTNEERIKFLSQFGWEVEETPEEEEVRIPAEFDRVFAGYNEIQKGQGLDLSKYKNKEVMRYTYEVTNYKGYNGVVYATLLIYRNKVIGGDVCSADPEGFIHGFEMIEK